MRRCCLLFRPVFFKVTVRQILATSQRAWFNMDMPCSEYLTKKPRIRTSVGFPSPFLLSPFLLVVVRFLCRCCCCCCCCCSTATTRNSFCRRRTTDERPQPIFLCHSFTRSFVCSFARSLVRSLPSLFVRFFRTSSALLSSYSFTSVAVRAWGLPVSSRLCALECKLVV